MSALYRRLLGDRFDMLPPLVRRLHDLDRPTMWSGRADVVRGTSPACRLIASVMRLPPHGRDQPLHVTFEPHDGAERWVRSFGDRRFTSVQRAVDGNIVETVGPVSLTMALEADHDVLALRMSATHAFGVLLPAALTPEIRTRESEQDGRYHFDVEAAVPVFGPLIAYRGWLLPPAR